MNSLPGGVKFIILVIGIAVIEVILKKLGNSEQFLRLMIHISGLKTHRPITI